MSPERSITISESVHGSTLITGDGNVIVIAARDITTTSTSQQAQIGDNPYQGLAAYTEKDAVRFFGREEVTSALWESFRTLHEVRPDEPAPIRILPVIGPSGSGKSSLVRAGLVPELALRPFGALQQPRVAILTPGERPLNALAGVLARIATDDSVPVAKSREFAAELERQAESGAYDGLQRIAELLPEISSSRLIVLVDQFEEIYTLCQNGTERNVFIENLLFAALSTTAYVSVIIVLRVDFLHQTQSYPALNQCIAGQGFIVPAMSEEELRRAISEPAALAGAPIDAGTINFLVNETVGRVGSLPLLQFALTRIWEGMQNGVSPTDTLDQIGGVGGALAAEAQNLYESLGEDAQRIGRRAFLRLVQLGEGVQDTRRRVRISDLVARQESLGRVRNVLDFFARPGQRLLTFSADVVTEETVEITHEALIEHWDLLRDWIDENRDDLRFDRRLTEAAEHWEDYGRPRTLLWRSPDLELLYRYYNHAGQDMTPLQTEFFEASRNRARQIRAGQIMGSIIVLILAAIPIFQLIQEYSWKQAAQGPVATFGAGPATLGGANFPAENIPAEQVIELDGFSMDKHEVSYRQYRLCMRAGRCSSPLEPAWFEGIAVADEQLPVVWVTAYQAWSFCEWIGRRLPSEAEWERAARGQEGRPWPWRSAEIGPENANVIFDKPPTGSVSVDSAVYKTGATPEGVMHLIGNVWEWTRTPTDCAGSSYTCESLWNGHEKIQGLFMRGGAWSQEAVPITGSLAADPIFPRQDIGFRCAQSGS